MTVEGNIKGIPRYILEGLEQIADYRLERDLLVDGNLAEKLAFYTSRLNREIAVLINRRGRVDGIAVGKNNMADLTFVSSSKNRDGGMAGLRLIHTHPGGSGALSGLDLSVLSKLGPDCLIAIGVDSAGAIKDIGLAYHREDRRIENRLLPGLADLLAIDAASIMGVKDGKSRISGEARERESAVLAVLSLGRSSQEIKSALDELTRLAETAGIDVLSRIVQKKSKPERATYIGKGKAEEIRMEAQLKDADLIIFDDELTPATLFNLEKLTGRKVIDRTMLILDIFASRAKSNEGKIQVELAQLKYMLPRLAGQGMALSRLAGGIGTRGPGESKLETDRRKIRNRITELERKLEEALKTRKLHQEKRNQEGILTAALVGYTNAGKSTLLNTLAGESTYVEDQLFATLDSLTRRVTIPGGGCFLLSDTVGFIRKLPHHLVAAFRSTLEEVREADLLIHVADGSAPDLEEQIEAVMKVLKELDVLNKPLINAVNKADLFKGDEPVVSGFFAEGETVYISAKKGLGIGGLLQAVKEKMSDGKEVREIFLPFEKGKLISLIHQRGKVLEEEYNDQGVRIKAEFDCDLRAILKREGLI